MSVEPRGPQMGCRAERFPGFAGRLQANTRAIRSACAKASHVPDDGRDDDKCVWQSHCMSAFTLSPSAMPRPLYCMTKTLTPPLAKQRWNWRSHGYGELAKTFRTTDLSSPIFNQYAPEGECWVSSSRCEVSKTASPQGSGSLY